MRSSATPIDAAPSLSADATAALTLAVQRNCDLADALHAADLSLCTYLLEMRELYRWQQGLPLSATPERAAVGAWIAAREAHWEALAEAPDAAYRSLPLGDAIDPFDAQRANDLLLTHRLVYGAGIERFGRPGFFLAELASDDRRDDARVLVTDREYARGINPPPAMSRDDLVLVRRDVLRRWLWTKMETASRRTAGDAFASAVAAYEAEGDTEHTLERMALGETETLVLHELGERAAAGVVGHDWESMLAAIVDRRTEVVARAVRDLLADCLVTLPTLLERGAVASIHFWFSTFDGIRRELAPALRASYASFCAGDRAPLERAVIDGRARFADEARAIAEAWRAYGRDGVIERVARISQAR